MLQAAVVPSISGPNNNAGLMWQDDKIEEIRVSRTRVLTDTGSATSAPTWIKILFSPGPHILVLPDLSMLVCERPVRVEHLISLVWLEEM